MINRIFLVVIVIPIAVILIALAVANRAPATFTIDPFNPGNPALTLQLPLFAMLFMALVLGILIGSLATWMSQGRYRRDARSQRKEVQSLMQEISQRKAASPQPQPTQVSTASLPAPLV